MKTWGRMSDTYQIIITTCRSVCNFMVRLSFRSDFSKPVLVCDNSRIQWQMPHETMDSHHSWCHGLRNKLISIYQHMPINKKFFNASICRFLAEVFLLFACPGTIHGNVIPESTFLRISFCVVTWESSGCMRTPEWAMSSFVNKWWPSLHNFTFKAVFACLWDVSPLISFVARLEWAGRL